MSYALRKSRTSHELTIRMKALVDYFQEMNIKLDDNNHKAMSARLLDGNAYGAYDCYRTLIQIVRKRSQATQEGMYEYLKLAWNKAMEDLNCQGTGKTKISWRGHLLDMPKIPSAVEIEDDVLEERYETWIYNQKNVAGGNPLPNMERLSFIL